jgi:hypothetical protein
MREAGVREDRTTLVRIEPSWDAWISAEVRICDLEDVHWHQPPGAPQPLLHGYVWCDHLMSGTLPHGCYSRPGPHRVRVCILKKHVLESTYLELVRRGYVAMGRTRHAEPAVARRLAAVRR